MSCAAIEEFLLKDSRSHITVKTPAANALYVLNHKRSTLVDLERRFGVIITLEADETLGAQHYAIFRGAIAEKPAGMPDPLAGLPSYAEEAEDADIEVESDEDEVVVAQPAERPAQAEADGQADHNRDRKRRRRRRRRGGKDREPGAPREAGDAATGHANAPADQAAADDDDGFEDDSVEAPAEGAEADASPAEADGDRKKRRRGKRGGKRNRPLEAGSEEVAAGEEMTADAGQAEPTVAGAFAELVTEVDAPAAEPQAEAAPAAKPKRAPRKPKKVAEAPAETVSEAAAEPVAEAAPPVEAPAPVAEAQAPAEPVAETVAANDDTPATDDADEGVDTLRPSRRKPSSENAQPAQPVVVSTTGPVDDGKPKKGGWWQRKGFF